MQPHLVARAMVHLTGARVVKTRSLPTTPHSPNPKTKPPSVYCWSLKSGGVKGYGKALKRFFLILKSNTVTRDLYILIFHDISLSSPHRTTGRETPFWDPGKSGHKNFDDFKAFDFTGEIQDDIKGVESGRDNTSQNYLSHKYPIKQPYATLKDIRWSL